MREIKFRIWDGAKNEWLASSNKDALPYYGFALVGEVMTVQSPPIWSLDKGNVVEQYIGLKDKNSTEIYEGDTVEVKHSDWTEPTIHVVEWCGDEKYPAFNLKPELDEAVNSIALVAQSDFFSVKVVGNIHENPELMEGK